MKLTPSTEQDIERLERWIEADPYHKDCLNPHWWLTGQGIFSFCLQDSEGPLAYFRLDEKNSDGFIRLHIQFAPREEVSRLRLIGGLFECIPVVQEFCKQQGGGIIFQSKNPSLIGFAKKNFNFEDFGQDDFVWRIEQAGT